MAAKIALLTETNQSTDKETQRTTLLNQRTLVLASLEWSTEELGRGAFGTVYKGRYGSSQVAVKVIPVLKGSPGSVKKQARAIENEVILLGNAAYPGILQCYGYARDNQANFIIVTEVAPKGSLEKLLYDETVPISGELMIAWLVDIGDAIAFLHDKSINHRDIKAENFLVFNDFDLKLCDFGLAREQTPSMRASAAGSLGFMAPEVPHTGATFPSDIYSYSMTSVQIMTRVCPKPGKAAQQVANAISALRIPPYAKLVLTQLL